MKNHNLTPSCCPYCGTQHNVGLNMLEDGKPRPGDLSVCSECAQVLEFDSNSSLVAVSDQKLKKLYREDATLEQNIRHLQRICRDKPWKSNKKHGVEVGSVASFQDFLKSLG